MNMQAINLLLLMATTVESVMPPIVGYFWVDNNGNQIVTNNGDNLIFNPGT